MTETTLKLSDNALYILSCGDEANGAAFSRRVREAFPELSIHLGLPTPHIMEEADNVFTLDISAKDNTVTITRTIEGDKVKLALDGSYDSFDKSDRTRYRVVPLSEASSALIEMIQEGLDIPALPVLG